MTHSTDWDEWTSDRELCCRKTRAASKMRRPNTSRSQQRHSKENGDSSSPSTADGQCPHVDLLVLVARCTQVLGIAAENVAGVKNAHGNSSCPRDCARPAPRVSDLVKYYQGMNSKTRLPSMDQPLTPTLVIILNRRLEAPIRRLGVVLLQIFMPTLESKNCSSLRQWAIHTYYGVKPKQSTFY